MWKDFFSSLSLIDKSGYVIITLILLIAAIAVILNITIRRLYAAMENDLRRHGASGSGVRHRFLRSVLKDAEQTTGTPNSDPGLQALVEHHFKREHKGALTAERFLKSAPGLTIVLGLIGTFYGLTLSIGKLVTLIAGDVSGVAEITQALTTGLAGALSGMSVAFSTSLFGIIASVLLVLLNVFSNLADKRSALLLRLEVYLDGLRARGTNEEGGTDIPSSPVQLDARTVEAIETLGASVTKLQDSIAGFDAALVGFSENTRDFQEFNLHLKDNIQRMSLGFADLSDTLKQQAAAMRSNPTR
jgi:hypothetical protein